MDNNFKKYIKYKYKYKKLKKMIGGSSIQYGDFNYDGAGILLVIPFFINDFDLVPCLLLARERNYSAICGYDVYEDFGGSLHDTTKRLSENALIELFEESAGTIKLTPKLSTLHNFCSFHDNTYSYKRTYRTYFFCLDFDIPELIKTMKSNLEILHKSRADSPFLECNDWKLFPLTNLTSATKINGQMCAHQQIYEVEDIDGNKLFVVDRVIKALTTETSNFYDHENEYCYQRFGDNVPIKGIDICKDLVYNLGSALHINDIILTDKINEKQLNETITTYMFS